MMLQQLEGINKGAAVFNHWKVHNGGDADQGVRDDGVGHDGGDDDDGAGDGDDDDGDGDGANPTTPFSFYGNDDDSGGGDSVKSSDT